MRLHRFSVESFGVLSGKDWDLAGSSAVFLGKNESGKTTFVDALLCVLYGAPSGREQGDKRFFLERYGEAKTWGRLEAVLDAAGKKGVKSKPGSPQGPEFAEKELFRRLLVLRAGECPIGAPEDSGFLPAFSQKIMGGGKVDLQAALKELEAVHSEHGNRSWQRLAASLEKRLLELRSRLEQASDLESAGKKAQDLALDVQAMKGKLEANKEKLASIQAAEDRMKARALRELKAKWEEACERSLKSRAPDALPIQVIREKSEAVKSLETDLAMAGESLRMKQAEKRRREQVVEQAGLERLRLPDRERRLRLAKTLEALEQAQAALSRPSGLAPAARLVIAVLAGVAAAALAHSVFPGVGAAAAAFIAAFGLGWFIGDRLMRRSLPEPAEGLDKAKDEYELAAEALGWKALDIEQVKGRLEETSRQDAGIEAKLEQARQEAQEASAEAGKLAEVLEAKDKDLQEAVRGRNNALATWGASTTAEAEERENLARAAADAKAERLADLRRSLAEPDLAEALVGEKVRLRVDELESGREPAVEHASLSEKQLTVERRNVESAGHAEEKALERLEGSLRAAEKVLNQGKGAVGDPAKLLAEALDLERRIKNLKLWREAAAEARRVISELASDLDTRVRNLVAESGPLFKRLSSGRYGGVALTGESVFKKDSLSVTHESQGLKPAVWLSSGAADLLWLSLRVTLAKRVFPEGGLMVLDEPFLTLDPERTRLAAEALLEDPGSGAWQFLILTKDERAAELAEAAGARAFELG